MSKIDTGGVANGYAASNGVNHSGLTWLDKCAMKAMQSIIIKDDGGLVDLAKAQHVGPSTALARAAYSFAQAMLAEKRRLEAD